MKYILAALLLFTAQGAFGQGHHSKAPNIKIDNSKTYHTDVTKNVVNRYDHSNDYIDRRVSNQIDDTGAGVIGDGQAQSQAANNEGNSLSVNETHPDDITVRQLGTLVSQPNNNTSSCIKVWGIASGNKDIQGILGIPDRDEQCDLDNAAKDAFSQGNHLLGWHWKCHMKSMQKVSHGRTPTERHANCMTTVKELYPTVIPLTKADQISAYKETIVPLTSAEKTNAFVNSLSEK